MNTADESAEPVDIVIVTAADGEAEAVRAVEKGAQGPWVEIPNEPGFGFAVWRRTYVSLEGHPLRVLLTKALRWGSRRRP